MKNLTVSTLRTRTVTIPREGKKDTVFQGERLDKYFSDIDDRLCVDVAVFDNNFNITFWINGTKNYFRSRYSREFDDSLGFLLYSLHKTLKTLFACGGFKEFMGVAKEIEPIIDAPVIISIEEVE